jgi:hypothetical protein
MLEVTQHGVNVIFTLKVATTMFAETSDKVQIRRGSSPKGEILYVTPAAKA